MNGMLGLDGLSLPPPARRGFIMGSLMVGFTTATAHGQAAPIHTDANGLTAGEVQVPVRDGTLPAYAASPAGSGTHPVVLVNEEIFGVHEYIKDTCRRLAKQGYLAVATEYYARLGDLSKMTDVQQIIRDVISRAPDALYMADADATVAWAAANKGDTNRLGVTGFCRGGRMTWLYAEHNPNLKAAVAWYGPVGGQTSSIQSATVADHINQLKCPVLGLYGGQDQGIPVDAVRAAE